MKTIPVEGAADPRIAPYVNVRDRDHARGDAFVVEGEVPVRVLLSPTSRYAVRSLLLESRRVEKLRDVLEPIAPHVPIYEAPQAVMDAIVGFPIHRGVLALAGRPPTRAPGELFGDDRSPALALGLVGVVNHDNVGGVFRSAAAFGVRGVVLDPVTCDPLYRKAVRVSVGGALLVPHARAASPDAVVDALAAAGFEVYALSARGDEAVDVVSPGPRAALLVGAEGPGLPPEVLARTRTVRIEMEPTLDSLNASVACGIALHALFRRGRR